MNFRGYTSKLSLFLFRQSSQLQIIFGKYWIGLIQPNFIKKFSNNFNILPLTTFFPSDIFPHMTFIMAFVIICYRNNDILLLWRKHLLHLKALKDMTPVGSESIWRQFRQHVLLEVTLVQSEVVHVSVWVHLHWTLVLIQNCSLGLTLGVASVINRMVALYVLFVMDIRFILLYAPNPFLTLCRNLLFWVSSRIRLWVILMLFFEQILHVESFAIIFRKLKLLFFLRVCYIDLWCFPSWALFLCFISYSANGLPSCSCT